MSQLTEAQKNLAATLGELRSAGEARDTDLAANKAAIDAITTAQAELATAQSQLGRQYELISNEWWVDQMLFFAKHPDESLEGLFQRFRIIDETTVDDIRSLAAIAFPTSSYVLVRQVPR